MAGDWDALLDLLVHAGGLKRLSRQGWLYIGVPEPESVAEHSYRVALMTLLLAQRDPTIDLARALTLALVHDLPEALAGDATPFDQHLHDDLAEQDREALFRGQPAYSDEADQAKRQAEEAALAQMTGGLPDDLRRLIVDAWEEYEARATPEARLVRQADKLEALLQAFEYEAASPGLTIESFRRGTEAAATSPGPRALLEAMLTRFWRESSEPLEPSERPKADTLQLGRDDQPESENRS